MRADRPPAPAIAATHDRTARALLAQEARALLTRIERLSPFALKMPMVTAATVSPAAQTGVETLLLRGRRELARMVRAYLAWLGRADPPPTAAQAQRRFNILRLRFNTIIRHFDVFASVLGQRSEHETGVWVAGLDDVAADALTLPGRYFQAPPIICYLDRNHGAAIRRAYTRLPGGESNPVAVISIPRERMIGSGIASSLMHKIRHQDAALLRLVPSLRAELHDRHRREPEHAPAWHWFEKWISEIMADFWSVARIGVGSTLGLMAVLSLPKPFVFRLDPDDPHPIPWLRVKASCAFGDRLYPHPQWRRLARVWQALYPPVDVDPGVGDVIARCERRIDELAALIAEHRPAALRGAALGKVLTSDLLRPERLQAQLATWRQRPQLVETAGPCHVFAVIGQARADNQLTPEGEARALSRLLTYWALKSALETTAHCAPRIRGAAAQAALI
ncbi:MAG TPA: hypothetical protein VFK02_28605 [Kofleriaceae bacterium]|nr:hypothetical protein [Kofleriaceae bacterium]